MLCACATSTSSGSPASTSGSSPPTASPAPQSSSAAASPAPPSESPTSPAADVDPLTHRLLEEGFATGAGVFHTGTTPDFRYSVRDGVYRVTAITAAGGVAMTYGEFARRAWAIDSSVVIVDAVALSEDAVIGVGCTNTSGKAGFIAYARPEGGGGFVIQFVDGEPKPVGLTWSEPVGGVGPLRSLRLSTYITSPLGDDVKIAVYVNGEKVPDAATAAGFVGCDGMMLSLVVEGKGAAVGFDDAVATVPGE